MTVSSKTPGCSMNDGAAPGAGAPDAPRDGLDRRGFLRTVVGASALPALAVAGTSASARDEQASPAGASPCDIIDVNVHLSRWPSRRLPGDDTATLVERLRARGVVQAWAATFDGLLHKDLGAANARLAEECRRHGTGMLVPVGVVNPAAPDWEEDLRRCAEVLHTPAVRLYPGYHGYKLTDPAFARLLRLAADRRLVVQLAVVMEDERMMHPLMRVEPVETGPLLELLGQVPRLRLVLLNALRTLRGKALADLLGAGEVYVEISMLETVGGVATLLAHAPLGRVLFGSHAPCFYFESALLKLRESPLSDSQLRAIRSENARGLLRLS